MELSNAARRILNDERLVGTRDRWFSRLQNLFDGRPDEFNKNHVFAVNGILGQPEDPGLIYSNPERWAVESLESLAEMAEKSANEFMFVPPCIESAIYGVHFIDSIFGAKVWFQDGQWYSAYLDTPVGSLKMPDLDNSPTWKLAQRAALKFVRQGVTLPLFGLPTIASALNIGINLYGEEILVAMLADPESAEHDLAVINRLLCEIHAWYRSLIPQVQLQPVISWNRTQPPGYGQLCGCSLQLISSDLYRDAVLPLDEALLQAYPNGGMIHLCGKHDQLIPLFRKMPHLKSLQVNDRAAHDFQLYFEGLREDQILYLNPCPGMTVERAVKITNGHRLVIADTISEPICKKNCK